MKVDFKGSMEDLVWFMYGKLHKLLKFMCNGLRP